MSILIEFNGMFYILVFIHLFRWQHKTVTTSLAKQLDQQQRTQEKINITYKKYASMSPNVADFVCTMIFLFVFMLISYVCESYDSNWIFTLLYSELYKRIALIVPRAKISWQIIWKFPRKLRRSRCFNWCFK